MPRIDSTYFGSMIINGRKFDNDLVLTWKGEILAKQKSHEFTKDEFLSIAMHAPDAVVIGTGTAGAMKVHDDVEVSAKIKGIELFKEKTDKAAETFNKLARTKRVIGIFHLTC